MTSGSRIRDRRGGGIEEYDALCSALTEAARVRRAFPAVGIASTL
jgi:hypothetical protein